MLKSDTKCLPGLNADFDGDILNIIGIFSDEMKYIFRKFNPVERMIMSRDSGMLNDYFTITKGQKIDLYYFMSCERGVEDFEERKDGEKDIFNIKEYKDEEENH